MYEVQKFSVYQFTHQVDSSYLIDYKFWKVWDKGWRVLTTHHKVGQPPRTDEMMLPQKVIEMILAENAADLLKTE